MTDAEADILHAMRPAADEQPPWLPPRLVGGTDASHHSTTLRRMAMPAKAWVEVRVMARRVYHYRITEKGVQALANHELMKVKT